MNEATKTTAHGAPIGQVETAEGEVYVIHPDGSREALEPGDAIVQGDTLATGPDGALAVTFIDESSFSLGSDGEMVVDELVYDSAAGFGEASFSVVEGVFVFVSGSIAKTMPDAMTVNTPVASIGVRGTKVAGRAAPEGEDNVITLLTEADGAVGEITVSTELGVQVMNRAYQTLHLNSRAAAPDAPEFITPDAARGMYGDAIDRVVEHGADRRDDGGDERGDDALPSSRDHGDEEFLDEAPHERAEDARPEGLPHGPNEGEIEIAMDMRPEEFEELVGVHEFEDGEFELASGPPPADGPAEPGFHFLPPPEVLLTAVSQNDDLRLLLEQAAHQPFGETVPFHLLVNRALAAMEEMREEIEAARGDERREDVRDDPPPPESNYIDGTNGDDVIDGTPGTDAIRGHAGDDKLYGHEDDDWIRGNSGDDYIHGGAGNDRLVGDEGDDTLRGGAGDDRLDGGAGNDTLIGDLGADEMHGGDGRDAFAYRSQADGTRFDNSGRRDESVAIDRIGDFESGVDQFKFDADAFGISTNKLIDGENFIVLDGEYDGDNARTDAFHDGEAVFVFDSTGTLYYDDNGKDEGYTVIAQVQEGGVVTADDIAFV